MKPPDWKPPRRNSYRLPGWDYAAPYAYYFVTLNAGHEAVQLTEPSLAATIITNLLQLEPLKGLQVRCYAIMSNHLHWLGKTVPGCANLCDTMHNFKGYLTYLWHQSGGSGALWQRNFYDHVLRPSEPEECVVEYIMRNPVEAELTREVGQYPYAKIVLRAHEYAALNAEEQRTVRPAEDPIGPGVYLLAADLSRDGVR